MTRRAALNTLAGTLAAAPGYRIFDPHVHVWKEDPQYPWAKETTSPPTRDATPEMLLELMKAHGVAKTVIIQVIYYRYDNSYEELKAPMTILAPITRMPAAGALIARFPELTVVIDHMADCPVSQPAELEKLIALARFPRVFVKISHTWSLSRQGYPYLDSQEHVKRLYGAFGPQRLMWATDWPMVEQTASYGQALRVVRDDMKFLNAEDKQWILSKTIERVWPFPA